jgi:2'-5' RNA ligase
MDAQGATERLFFALSPDEAARKAMDAFAPVARSACGGRAVQARNLHLTLAFVGHMPVAAARDVAAAVAGVPRPDYAMVIDQVQHWRHNRILWLGPSTVPEPVARMCALLRHALRESGVRHDDKPFVPHVTLLRAARAPATPLAMGPVAWRGRGFSLFAVHRDAAGLRYDAIG